MKKTTSRQLKEAICTLISRLQSRKKGIIYRDMNEGCKI